MPLKRNILTAKEQRQVRQIKKRQAAERHSKMSRTVSAGKRSATLTKRSETSEMVANQVKKNKKLLKKYK